MDLDLENMNETGIRVADWDVSMEGGSQLTSSVDDPLNTCLSGDNYGHDDSFKDEVRKDQAVDAGVTGEQF